MQLDPKEVEELAKTLYIRALKLLPPDIKRGFDRLVANEDRKSTRLNSVTLESRMPSSA